MEMEARLRKTGSGCHPEEADPEDGMHRVSHLVEHMGYTCSGHSFGFVRGD